MPKFFAGGGNNTLNAVSGIAQGATAFLNAYQTAQTNQLERARLNSEMELRRQQVEILRREAAAKYGPVTLDMNKLDLVTNMKSAGMEVPGSIENKLWQSFMGNLDRAPEMIPRINSGVNQARARQFQLPSQTVAERSGRPVVEQDGSGQSIEFTGGMEFTAPSAPSAPSSRTVTLSRDEFDFLKDRMKSRDQAEALGARIGVQARGQELQLQGKLAEIDARMAQANSEAERNQIMKDAEAQLRKELAHIQGRYQVKSATIRNQGSKKESPEARAVIDQLKILIRPPSGFSLETSEQKRRKQEQVQGLRQRYKQITGVDISPADLGQVAPRQPSPAPSGGKQKPPAPARIKASSKAEIKAAPVNSIIEYQGKVYKKTGENTLELAE